ncbi:MAG: O-antigen ligase family protein [Candidatus Shapirobacteria bacterium]
MSYLTKLIRFLYGLLFLLIPLIFTSFNSELFELPKMFFVYFLTILIVFFHLLNVLRGQSVLFRRSLLDLPFILFLISQIISTLISIDPHTSVFGYYSRQNGGLLSIICYLLLYWTLIVYLDDYFKEKIIFFSLISGFLVAVFGIAQHFGIDKNLWVQDVQNRVFSTLGQPNWLGAYLCILLPFSVSKFLSSKDFIHKLYFALLTSIFYLCLLFTKSKSSIFAALISIGILLVFTFLKNKTSLKPSLFILLLLLSSSLLINNPIKQTLLPKYDPIPLVPNSTINITPSGDIRKYVWQGAIDLWKKFPLFGTGTETFAYTYYWTRPVAHNLTSEWDFLYNKAHNEYLNFLATTGTFGFLTYLFLILAILKLSTKNLAVFSGFVSIIITNFFGFSVVITSLYFFLLPALAQNFSPSPKPSIKLPKPLTLGLTIFTCFLFFLSLRTLLFYYLADITFAESESLDSQNDYSGAYQKIKTSLYYRSSEPVYLNQSALLSAKLAVTFFTQKNSVQAKDYENQAISASNQTIAISPGNINFWKERAQVYYYLSTIDSKYLVDSIDSLLKATRLAPTDAKAFYMIAKFLEIAGQTTEAAAYYQKAIDLKSNYDYAFFDLGVLEFNLKNYSAAKSNFENALKFAPNNLEAQTYLEKIEIIN